MKKYIYMGVLFGMGGIGAIWAQESVPTIFYGEAATEQGGENIAVVEQPENAPNPLGNPIVGNYVAPKAYNAADALVKQPQVLEQEPQFAEQLGHPMGKMNSNPAIQEIEQQQEFGRFVNYETEMMQ